MPIMGDRRLVVEYRYNAPDLAALTDFERELKEDIYNLVRQKARQRRHHIHFIDQVTVERTPTTGRIPGGRYF